MFKNTTNFLVQLWKFKNKRFKWYKVGISFFVGDIVGDVGLIRGIVLNIYGYLKTISRNSLWKTCLASLIIRLKNAFIETNFL